MLKFPSRRVLRSAAVAAVAVAALPASAQAIDITSLKAGPVPVFDNGTGLPFVPNQSPPAPVTLPGPPPTPVPQFAASVEPGSADTNCAYGVVQQGAYVAEQVPTWNGQGTPPAPGSTAQNALPVYSTAAADQPLTLAPQANAFSDFCIAFRADSAGNPNPAVGGERVRNNVVTLPVGVTAGIDAQVKCSEAQYKRHAEGPSGQERFEPNDCPVASQVGTATVRLRVPAPSDTPLTPGGIATRDSPGRVFALDTPAHLAARFGIALIGGSRVLDVNGAAAGGEYAIPDRHTKFYIDVSQTGEATIGLVNQTDDLAQTVPIATGLATSDPEIRVVPIQLAGGAFRFWGKAADHSVADQQKPTQGRQRMATDFMRMPTTCSKDLVTKLTVNPYGPDQVASPADKTAAAAATADSADSNAVRLTGCEALPFDVGFNAKLTGDTKPGAHPGLELDITVPDGHEDLGGTEITLPHGVATDLTRVQNACEPGDFFAQRCNDAQIIGRVSAEISGIASGQVSGDIYKVRVDGQTLPALGFNFKGRLPLRVAGVTSIDPSGRIVNRFSDLPALPQRALKVELFGGDRGILQLGPAENCQISEFKGVFTGQNGKSDTEAIRTVCGEKFRASLKNADSRRPYLTFSGAAATGKKVKSIRLSLPKGLTIGKNKIRSGSKIDKLEKTVKGRTSRVRLNSKRFRFTIPNPGSNGLRIITRRGTLNTSAPFRKRDNDISVIARIVYTDGSKVNIEVPLKRT